MSNGEGPWGAKKHPVAARTRNPLLWIALGLAGGLGIWELFKLFPGAIASDFDRAALVNWIGFLALLSVGLVAGRRYTARETFRNIAIWCGVLAVLMLGYTFRDELGRVGLRLRSELIPGYPVATGTRQMTLTQSENGSYFVNGVVNGLPMHFLIDTGASDIVLSPDDARRLGIDIASLDYFRQFETAHGGGRGAPATVARLAVGSFVLTDVPVTVNQSPMSSSLLGLTFLDRLDSYEFRGRHLTLRW
jgi:aspartyl protease family protein